MKIISLIYAMKFDIINQPPIYKATCLTYYTTPLNHNFAWVMGMTLPTEVRMLEIDLKEMESLADQTEAK